MAFLKPFKAVRYNKDRIKQLSRVVAPPYDIISPKAQDALYRIDPHNIVRLILNKTKKSDNAKDNRYIRARQFFETWLKTGVLTRDTLNAIYIYSQVYKDGRRSITRTGFISLMDLDIDKDTRVLPHENTLAAPKRDRLNLMREVNANLSPIFVLYEDKRHDVARTMKTFTDKNKPVIDITVDDVRHMIWKMDDMRCIGKISAMMEKKEIFIADGHHRFETARNYAIEIQNNKDIPEDVRRDSRYMMAYFVESDDRILSILPTHRLIKDIGGLNDGKILDRLCCCVDIKRVSTLTGLMSQLNNLSGRHVFGMYTGKGRFYILKLNRLKDSDRVIGSKSAEWKRLDVSILHLFIMQHALEIRDVDDNVDFVKNPKEAVDLVDRNKFKIAFFLNPTKVSQVKRIAKLGEKMPRKATYFYPKPLSGLVINKFGN